MRGDSENTVLECALAKYTAEDDWDHSLCASCGEEVAFSQVNFGELPLTLAIEVDRFEGPCSYKPRFPHITFPVTLQMSRCMIAVQPTVYDLYTVVVHDGEQKGVGEYALLVKEDGESWFFHWAGLPRERVSEETVLGADACVLFYKCHISGWHISECSEPWDVSDI
ncbi:Ubiquitin carboxyl-terminal hydrolase 21 [Coemansia sp. IMI 209127]|nr:Ubiquitin carboxyl-terminal hydrolase 21 [Coemansia sp. IMI 209127]